jgi:hypothetical protein
MARFHATPEGNVQYTAAEETARDAEEAEWADEAAVRAFVTLRQERDTKLAKSDYMGNSDVTMSTAWKTYRKALRDLPGTLDDTTVLETITWPDEPE